jgi:Mitochondrial carrier protein
VVINKHVCCAQRDVVLLPGQTKAEMTVAQSLAVASLAGSGNVLVTNPIWLAVTRMQTAQGKADRSVTFQGELKAIVREGGIPALWKVRDACSAAYFCTAACFGSPLARVAVRMHSCCAYHEHSDCMCCDKACTGLLPSVLQSLHQHRISFFLHLDIFEM